jgi:hypothetical protein
MLPFRAFTVAILTRSPIETDAPFELPTVRAFSFKAASLPSILAAVAVRYFPLAVRIVTLH